jgi:hypothetical protein
VRGAEIHDRVEGVQVEMAQAKTIDGILLLYRHPIARNAPTIMEHVNSFQRYSKFKVWSINTEFGFPRSLDKLQFKIIVLHYSLFGSGVYLLSDRFLDYLERNKESYKVAFFQDEYQFCQQRFAFINRFCIDCVYTLLEPRYFKDVYQRYTSVPKLVYTLTGYVSDDLIKNAQKFAKPDYAREIDVGYRTRQLPFWMGRGSQEKHEIAVRFRECASGLGLRINIETEESKRLYGNAWYKFLGNCNACLGVEAGVSIFDIEDTVRSEYKRLISRNPKMTFEEMSERLLKHWEGNIVYRTISPRHFEAAAFRICQILYEGDYSGIMKPMVHYIPLKRDFSNFEEVIRLFRDNRFRQQITENCYRDLIASGRYSYCRFVESFDLELRAEGLTPEIAGDEVIMASAVLDGDIIRRRLVRAWRTILYGEYPSRRILVLFGRPVIKVYHLLRRYLVIIS